MIEDAPGTLRYARTFEIHSGQSGSIDKVGLVRLGAATHGDDQGQRYVPLAFTASGSVITATGPATKSIAPPGYYMLFITDSDGVPSVAKIIQLPTDQPPTRSDYDGDGDADIAVWRPSTGTWYVRGRSGIVYGTSTDKPVPADYSGDGVTDIAVWRPSTGTWYIRGKASVRYGVTGDIPVAGDYDGDHDADIAVWRPSTGTWYIRGRSGIAYGVSTDKPVPADYSGDGLTVWRPSTARWYIRGSASVACGQTRDIPLTGR